MPRYFFSTTHGDQRSAHEQAMEFPNDRAAWSEAVQCCGEILRDIDGHLQPNLEWRMDVNDENHALIYRLRLIPEAYRRINPRHEPKLEADAAMAHLQTATAKR